MLAYNCLALEFIKRYNGMVLILRGCPKTRISAGRDDLNAKEKRVIIGDKREE